MIQHPHDQIEAFALGSLDEDDQRTVLEHADACPTCAVLLADAMAGVGALATLESPRPVDRALARPLAAPVARRRIGAPAWVATAALAACLALLFWNVRLRDDALTVPVGALVHSHFVHHPMAGGPQSAGSAKVLQAPDGHWIYVVADGLTPHGRYALWETRSGATQKVAELTADDRGQAARYVEQPQGAIEAVVLSPGDKPFTDAGALRWP
ncbi:MAG TPA: hypothetical protein VKF82_10135 [Candidatus Eremiobacteraceae bacterium]|nr:hypothetical protein [Candidatus Eremiobacteraceae bacterium]